MKLHPDVMPAFLIMVANFMFLQAALPFGADFSPQNWEPVRRLIEILAEKLYDDKSLRSKHRQYLDMLHWDPTLGDPTACFVPAKLCTQRTGVLDSEGHPKPTPQRLFVDDSVYAEVFQALRTRLEQAIACGIEAIFILLGQSDLKKRQDPISFAKMVEMMISHLNKILGQLINTRIMEVQVPPTYITLTLRKLKPFHQGRKSFTVKEMETTTGMLVFISSTALWLKFLMSHIYVSIAAAIGSNTAHLRRTNKQFRQLLKDARAGREPTRESTFAQSESAKAIHSCPWRHFINSTLQ